MKRHHIAHYIATAAVATAVATTVILSQHRANTGVVPSITPPPVSLTHIGPHIAPSSLYPDSRLTAGNADTLQRSDLIATYHDNCPQGKASCTYSQDHRNVTPQVHQQVYTEYNVPKEEQNILYGEVDHFWPLCAGGSNDIANLWYQPISNPWNGNNYGFKEKDRLETWICAQIKAGTITDIQGTYDAVTNDWMKFYLDNQSAISGYNIKNPPLGGVVE